METIAESVSRLVQTLPPWDAAIVSLISRGRALPYYTEVVAEMIEIMKRRINADDTVATHADG